MHLLNRVGQAIINLLKGTWLLPKSITFALEQRQRQIALDAVEAERLDRIRHPSDYLGK